MFGSPPKPPSPTWQGPSSRYGSEPSKPSTPARKPRPEDYKTLPAFEYVNLSQLAHSNPAVYAAVTSTPKPPPPEDPKPSKKTKSSRKPTDPEPAPGAVGYAPQPSMSPGRPQHLCAICSTPIGHGEGQDFTGNLPCRHRGPCSSRLCILAYYGSLNRWALPCSGGRSIYCQAPGCGTKVEAWCQVQCQENKGSSVGKIVYNNSYHDPKVVKAEEERRQRDLERERAASGHSWPSELRSDRAKRLDRLGQVLCVACCLPCILRILV